MSDRDRHSKHRSHKEDRDRRRDSDRDSRHHRRHRDRSKSPIAEKRSRTDERQDPEVELAAINAQEQLEIVMQQRRERVEEWRKLRQARDERLAAEAAAQQNENGEEPTPTNGNEAVISVDGALEDELEEDETAGDSDEEESNGVLAEANGNEEPAVDKSIDKSGMEINDEEMPTVEETEKPSDDDVDPLDAFMAELTQKQGKGKQVETKARVITLNVAETKDAPKKGEIIDNEDEQGPATDDFDVEQVASSLIAKGRQLSQTDHTKVYYRPFRKNFYNEVPELQRMTKKEVEAYREELDSIKVRGVKCPKPIKNWAQSGVEMKVMKVLKSLNYTKPTPIQAQGIPAILSGRDVIGIAKTGSGKTLAFLLPMFRHVLDQDPLDDMDGPIALIMSPTRELALQTYKEANKFCRYLDIRAVCVYGGVQISDQIADLKKGAEVVVCTPGRMIDMLAANNGRVTNLRRVTYLVLDEADRMFDMGFEPQVMKIINNIRPDRQTVLFSATFPKQMEALARKVLQKPVEIQIGGKSIVCADVIQHAMIVEEHVKFLKLLELLGQYWEAGNVLVFVDKQEKCDDLVSQLMQSGYNCAPLHGGIDQFDRDSNLIDFKTGRLKLMVATSVAARGLDVKKLILVVNYDCPNHYEDYVHRVGRTGRAGNKGHAYTFILPTGQETMAGEVCRAFETAGATPPTELKELWENYKKQMEAEGKKVYTGGGYSGSGYKYDDNEEESEINKRRLTKLVHGLEAGGDEDDEDIEQQLNSMMKSKSRIVNRNQATTSGEEEKAARPTKAQAQAQEKNVAAARAMAEKIAAAKQLNAVPMVEKDATALTAEAVMKGEQAQPIQLSAAAIAKQTAEKLNSKLNYLPSALNPLHNDDFQQQYFEEELEINDFPQQIRYKVCSRESMAQVQEFADVGISVKGTHYPPGKEPKEGMDRKLYLFLEARDQISLRRAREEILRIMKEALRQMTSMGNRGQLGGRYRLF
ncbi:RNA helicase [Aphelenchoides besseyi]|nr:RNA helicase [Aphelenchoides besseyi]